MAQHPGQPTSPRPGAGEGLENYFQADKKTPLAMGRERAAGNAFESQPEPGMEYEDFHGEGGWSYRIFPDGMIKIISAPEGHKAGAKLTGGAAYNAIKLEYEAAKTAAMSQEERLGESDPYGESVPGEARTGESMTYGETDPYGESTPGSARTAESDIEFPQSTPGEPRTSESVQGMNQRELDERLGTSDRLSAEDIAALKAKVKARG